MQIIGDKLGKDVAEYLGVEYHVIDHRIFPDGEINFKIPLDKLEKNIVLISRKRPDENVNEYLARLYFTTRTLHDAKHEISLVMPYFVYARQDDVFRKGEPLSSQYVADLFDPYISNFFTVTAHTHRRDSIQPLFKHAKAKNISGIPALAEALPKIEDAFVLGPDTESIIWSKEMADILGLDNFGAFKKFRDKETGEITVTAEDFDFKNRDLIVVDDMVSTGGTIERAVRHAKEQGAKRVYLTFVHSVFSNDALKRLQALQPVEIISTNTLESSVSSASIHKLLAKYL